MTLPHSKHNGNRRNGYDAAWTKAAREISLTNLGGLRVRCPSCHRSGTLLSKWEPKTPVKPLFIVHTNSNSHFKACPLAKEEAVVARQKVTLGSKEVVKIFRLGKPFVLFSGGKDSISTLQYLKRLGDRAGVEITALHVDTTAGFPEVEEYVQEVCKELGVPLVTVRPTHDYFEIAKKWGIPGVRSRWCCETLKVAPMRRFLATVEGPKVIYDGIRAAESHIRATYTPVWFHPAFRCVSISPIFRWSDAKVERYNEGNGLPENPASSLRCSGECWCGAYKSRTDFEALLEIHPDIFEKLVEVEEAQAGKYTFMYENGKRVPLTSLRL